ncbi:1,2-dihydroxy-3-keto-5-methylthiopentene dioxygenase [Sphingomonas sp.]|uniref:1,2-dihydroxy-3-keto-5-methylthiopentene dioxygenase n=1 Tax=Sphingomonas sp. TaxID=28214 RepID=UPI002BCC4ECB|nr:cupin domain-containing protein [Sphingomonas sp.]HWK35177.1 cupin domain-containing protein [Sphingomonas sp.]
MTELTRFDEGGGAPDLHTSDPDAIAAAMRLIGVRFERWPLRALSDDASGDEVIAAYAADIARLKAVGGYRSVDVVRMMPDHPDRAAARTKFLEEHRHNEDEVRFFVAGEGLFTLHSGGKVHALLCTAGDLISVPAGMPHWFDMGPSPRFTAIRLFVNPDGWIAHFTGDDIAARFPRHEPVAA